MEDYRYLTVGFTYEDSNIGTEYTAKSTFPVFEEIGDTDLGLIGTQFKCFLDQIGYAGMRNDYMLMESLTGDEYDAIVDFLEAYREKAKE